jgi:multidrug efflux pump subunit AcrA (membrane-fusion protein)
MKINAMHPIPKTIIACLLLALALSGCFGADAAATPTPRPFALATLTQGGTPTVFPVTRGDVVDELRFSGNVDLATEEEVFFATGGRLAAIAAEHGATVAAGQVIAALDARSQRFDVEDAQLALALAEGRLAQQQKKLATDQFRLELALAREQLRLDQLKAARSTTAEAIALQELAVRLAEFELKQLTESVGPDLAIERERAQLRLLRAQNALSDTVAASPIAGQLLLLEGAEVDEQVAAYAPVAVVVDPDSTLVTASLPPEALRTLHEGLSVTLEAGEGSAMTPIAATLARLPAPYGSGRALVEVVPQDPAEGRLLQPGTTVQVVAERGRAANVLWVPPSALQGFRDAYFVRLADGTEAPVTIGLQNDQRVEILTGLTEGQTVLGR